MIGSDGLPLFINEAAFSFFIRADFQFLGLKRNETDGQKEEGCEESHVLRMGYLETFDSTLEFETAPFIVKCKEALTFKHFTLLTY